MDGPEERTHILPIRERDKSTHRETPDAEFTPDKGPRRRHATLYDAVAGKVSYRQGPGAEQEEARYTPRHPKSIRYSTKDTPLAPDEVLFRRRDAPERYLEHDIYYAHERDLPRAGQGILPESDLLKAIHGYASAFCSTTHGDPLLPDSRSATERSMDETALLAFGILLQEAGKEVLGRRGDLVFTEGQDDAPPPGSRGGDEIARDDTRIVGHHDVTLRRGPKRRRVADTDDE
ncbi:hypothetical protein FALBO_12423 [Fusarium albosuccineum]|uniref:Uncharacterized protein n=1 Tax=Fusarium albosuccineum TaxID=1237068 RepID=A0A8H4P944_9HYPO|nr:hypothetical protein FALBO_12423 [Fusarium albosuccineum]